MKTGKGFNYFICKLCALRFMYWDLLGKDIKHIDKKKASC